VWNGGILPWAGHAMARAERPSASKGSPANPFTWEDAVEKSGRYTRSLLVAERATALIDAIGGLDHVTDVAEVARLAAGAHW
jgi:hypothetical protein